MPDAFPPVVEQPIFFLDYDGTLAPIVSEPMQAFPHPELPALLQQLLEAYPAWIVTGRDLRALGRLLPVRLPAVGLHGVEWGIVGEVHEERISDSDRETIRSLRKKVPALEGVSLEDKGALFAVHYRNAPDPDEARQALANWARAAPDTLQIIWGKRVVELRPRGQSKGEVVTELLARYPGREPVYLGDDATDEDAFRALGSSGACIKVGPGETEAPYRIDDVRGVLAYLRRYVATS